MYRCEKVNYLLVCLICACSDLSVFSSSWGLGRAGVCDCGTPWTFLVPFLPLFHQSILLIVM